VSTHVDGERATRAAARGCRKQIADAEQPLLPDQLVELDEFFRRCVDTLPTHRRHVLRHYAVVDVAHEIVGVGSVGTRCLIILIENGDREPLFLQFKEAGADDGRRRWATSFSAGPTSTATSSADRTTTTSANCGTARFARHGEALALAHARCGDASVICGYLGKDSTFNEVVTEFDRTYAAVNEADFDAHASAIADGTVEARFVL